MSEPEVSGERELAAPVKAFLAQLYRDPRYLLVGTLTRFGEEKISFIESCAVFSAAGEVQGQLLLNREYARRGRPDGERPYGYHSLLDYYLSRQTNGALALDEDEVAALREESWQYYVRRNFDFQLGDYAQAREDAEHNLGILNLAEHSEIAEETKWGFLRWWPWIERDRAVAQALLDLLEGDLEQAATELYRVGRHIQQYGARHAERYQEEEGDNRSICEAMEEHVSALVELLRQEQGLPVCLEEKIDQAAAQGDEEEVGRLRAELIRRTIGDEP